MRVDCSAVRGLRLRRLAGMVKPTMRRSGAWYLLAGLLGAVSCVALRPNPANRLPDDVRAVLTHAGRFQLLSLDPNKQPGAAAPGGGQSFHDWKVLGRLEITDRRTRGRVLDAVEKAIAESDGSVALCFNPRHGVHATSGGHLVDLVICYECNQVYVYLDGKQGETVLTAPSAQPVLDDVLKAAQIYLGPRP